MEPENFSTQWGVFITWPDGDEAWDAMKDRATAERMIKNMTTAPSTIKAELVWRGVTPWIKASI